MNLRLNTTPLVGAELSASEGVIDSDKQMACSCNIARPTVVERQAGLAFCSQVINFACRFHEALAVQSQVERFFPKIEQEEDINIDQQTSKNSNSASLRK